MEPSVKGNIINAIKGYLIKSFGPQAIDRVLEQMEPEDRQILSKDVFGASWFPEKTTVNFLATIERVFGKGDYELCRKIGYHNAQVTIPKVYRFFVRFGNPHIAIRNTALFWRQVNSHGRYYIVSSGPKSATSRLIDLAFPNKAVCSAVEGFDRASLEMCGAKNVSIRQTKCVAEGADCCEFFASWT